MNLQCIDLPFAAPLTPRRLGTVALFTALAAMPACDKDSEDESDTAVEAEAASGDGTTSGSTGGEGAGSSVTTGTETGSVTSTTAGSTTAGSTTEGSTDTTGATGPTQSLEVINLLNDMPWPGLRVCEWQAAVENCAMTDATGVATLPVAEGQALTFEVTGTGLRPHLMPLRGGLERTHHTTRVVPALGISVLFNAAGVQEDPSKGLVLSVATTGFADEGGVGVSMATASISPASGQGPFYSGADRLPDPAVTSTSELGTFMFTNVDPGTVEIAVEHPAAACTSSVGTVGQTPNSVSLPVVAGAVTTGSSMHCK